MKVWRAVERAGVSRASFLGVPTRPRQSRGRLIWFLKRHGPGCQAAYGKIFNLVLGDRIFGSFPTRCANNLAGQLPCVPTSPSHTTMLIGRRGGGPWHLPSYRLSSAHKRGKFTRVGCSVGTATDEPGSWSFSARSAPWSTLPWPRAKYKENSSNFRKNFGCVCSFATPSLPCPCRPIFIVLSQNPPTAMWFRAFSRAHGDPNRSLMAVGGKIRSLHGITGPMHCKMCPNANNSHNFLINQIHLLSRIFPKLHLESMWL